MILGFVGGWLPPNEPVSLSRVGRKLAEEQGAYVLRYHREGVGGALGVEGGSLSLEGGLWWGSHGGNSLLNMP